MGKTVMRSIRIPTELDTRMFRVVRTGGRYDSIAQFITAALHRLVTFEEGEMATREKLFAGERSGVDPDQLEFNFGEGGSCGR